MSLFDVYPLFDIEPVKAEGSYLWDKDGTQYLDFYGGHAVISIGHNHPLYVKRIKDQLDKIGFYSNSVKNSLQAELAEKILTVSGHRNYNLFLCNSGAEAVENALKVASFYNGRKKVIAFRNSFHGRTSAALSVTDDSTLSSALNKNHDVVFLPMNDADALETALYGDKFCAVIIEGIQGVGGVHVPTKAFLKRARAICDYTGALLILDEIQSGYGRTGKFFAHQHFDVKPDIITIAKGMGNGFPVAGVLIHAAIPAKHGMLGTTFGGNHLACAAALSVLEVLQNEALIDNAWQMGEYLKEKLLGLEGVVEVRGLGLMLGLLLKTEASKVRKELFEKHKIFTGSSAEKNVIRILPALNVNKKQVDVFIDALSEAVSQQVVYSEVIA